jgi:two-component system, response regulator YesN
MKYKILIVDDDEAILKPYQEFFTEYGFFAETVPNGKQGLEKLKTAEFDVAIVDIQMPVMNGIEMIRQAKEAGVDTDMIILTGYGGEKEAVQALKLGVVDWFYKHEVTMSLLKNKVDALTKGALENVRLILKDLPTLEEWDFDGR